MCSLPHLGKVAYTLGHWISLLPSSWPVSKGTVGRSEGGRFLGPLPLGPTQTLPRSPKCLVSLPLQPVCGAGWDGSAAPPMPVPRRLVHAWSRRRSGGVGACVPRHKALLGESRLLLGPVPAEVWEAVVMVPGLTFLPPREDLAWSESGLSWASREGAGRWAPTRLGLSLLNTNLLRNL